MSFTHFKSYIEEGDTVILFINNHQMHVVDVKSKKQNKNLEEVDNVFQTQYGALTVSSLIGKLYGSKIILSKGWVYVLHPTSELWSLNLPHRTQIIYTPDISMILFQLELKSGSVICEAGTGSGSLTHALARTVYPDGHVYSFDFHETRVAIAEEEFKNHDLSSVVTVRLRDVCEDGYGEDMNHVANAVFLDLPAPWKAIPHAIKCLKKTGGRIASFSPCIEQVQKTCLCLRSCCLVEIETVECLQREFSVSKRSQPVLSVLSDEDTETQTEQFLGLLPPLSMPGHTGYITFATLPPEGCRSVVSCTTSLTEFSELKNSDKISESL